MYKTNMGKNEIPAEAAKKLEEIENKYDIFFIVNKKKIWDYFEINSTPDMTLKVKAGSNLPFTLINDLKQHFQLIESAPVSRWV